MKTRRLLFLIPIWALIVTVPSSAAENQAIDIGIGKQLLVDDFAIARKVNLTRELGKVTKANEAKPIFTEGWFYGTVLFDEGKFKMWFRKPGQVGYGYAESGDGIRFEKKADLEGINFAGDYNLAVMIDPHETDPAHRYKGGYDAPGMAAGVAHSADGIHWTPYNDGKPLTYRAADCHNQIIWDDIADVYRLFTRTDFGSGGGPRAFEAAKNFEVRGTRSMTNPDIKADPTNWKLVRHWFFNKEGPQEYLRRQIYSMTVWIYEGIYLALMSVYEYPADISEGTTRDTLKRHERDVLEYYIATSRDCDDWDLNWVYDGEPIVPRGPDGSFDKDMVFPSSTIVTHDDRHWIYYGGSDERHGSSEVDPPVFFEQTRAIGLATLRLDGFVCLAAQEEAGFVETKPFVLKGNTFELNVDAGEGEVWVEVLDGNGDPTPALSGENSIRYQAVDNLRLNVGWRNRPDLEKLLGKVVRLRVHLRNARLYSFRIQP